MSDYERSLSLIKKYIAEKDEKSLISHIKKDGILIDNIDLLMDSISLSTPKILDLVPEFYYSESEKNVIQNRFKDKYIDLLENEEVFSLYKKGFLDKEKKNIMFLKLSNIKNLTPYEKLEKDIRKFLYNYEFMGIFVFYQNIVTLHNVSDFDKKIGFNITRIVLDALDNLDKKGDLSTHINFVPNVLYMVCASHLFDFKRIEKYEDIDFFNTLSSIKYNRIFAQLISKNVLLNYPNAFEDCLNKYTNVIKDKTMQDRLSLALKNNTYILLNDNEKLKENYLKYKELLKIFVRANQKEVVINDDISEIVFDFCIRYNIKNYSPAPFESLYKESIELKKINPALFNKALENITELETAIKLQAYINKKILEQDFPTQSTKKTKRL